MKRIVCAILAAVMCFAIVGCGGGSSGDGKGVLTWHGMEDQRIVAGNKVDLMQGLSVVDSIDGDITDKVVILNDIDHEDILEEQGWLDSYIEFDSNLSDRYDVYYMVENSTGVKEFNTRAFIVNIGHNVRNGDFSLGTFSWTFDKPGGDASFSATADGSAKVTIKDPGSEWWAIQLYQSVNLKAGVTYKVTVEAKSPQENSISFSYENPAENYKMLMGGVIAKKLSADFTEYVNYYTAPEDYYGAKAVMYMGYQLEDDIPAAGTSNEIIIKSIYIEPVSVCPDVEFTIPTSTTPYYYGSFDAETVNLMEGVSATANGDDITDSIKIIGDITHRVSNPTSFVISYVVERPDGFVAFRNRTIKVEFNRNPKYQIINDNFADGRVGWTADVNQTDGRGNADFTPVTDGMQIKINTTSTANWHIMLMQSGLYFPSGATYRISITLKAENISTNDKTNKFNVEVAENAGTGSAFTPAKSLGSTTLPAEFTTFTFDHEPTAATPKAARIGFLCGTVAANTIITISSFTVTVVS